MRGLRGRSGRVIIEAEQQRIILEYERNHRHDTVKHIDSVAIQE